MTFQKIKEVVVDEQKRMTSKQLTKLTIQLALAMIGIVLSLGLTVYSILGFSFTLLVIVGAMVTYMIIFDLFVQDLKAAKNIIIFGKLWWIYYILTVIIFLVLKTFRFI